MQFLLTVLLATTLDAPAKQLAREVYKELIEINTTDSSGNNTRAAEAMAARLRAAGFAAEDVKVLAPAPRKGNLVARLRGRRARSRFFFSPTSTWWRLGARTGRSIRSC